MLSVEPWLVEPDKCFGWPVGAPEVSVLSVEPWLVEPVTPTQKPRPYRRFQCSQSSRGWWNQRGENIDVAIVAVSVLSVEPWLVEPQIVRGCSDRERVSVLSVEPWLVEPAGRGVSPKSSIVVSALSVEPWLVERDDWNRAGRVMAVSVLSVEPWLVEPNHHRQRRGRDKGFQCSQSSRGWWNAQRWA